MKNIKNVFSFHRPKSTTVSFIRSLVVGGISTVIDILLYSLFLPRGLGVSISGGYLISTMLNYELTDRRVYAVSNRSKRAFVMFVGLSIVGLLLNYILIWGLVSLGGEKILSKIIATIIVFCVMFFLRKKFIFS